MEFKVNDIKQQYPMKLGEGGEAFFVFETSEDVPESQQTSPIVSPATSPPDLAFQQDNEVAILQEPEFLDLNMPAERQESVESQDQRLRDFLAGSVETNDDLGQTISDFGRTPSSQRSDQTSFPTRVFPPIKRSASEEIIQPFPHAKGVAVHKPQPIARRDSTILLDHSPKLGTSAPTERSISPPLVSPSEAFERAKLLSEKLASSKIPSLVTESGDLMLDMTGYKSREEDALRAEIIARKVLSEEFAGHYDIGALIAADEHGNLWIYRSEEAKNAALRVASPKGPPHFSQNDDPTSDSEYNSDEDRRLLQDPLSHVSVKRKRAESGPLGLITPPDTPTSDVPDGMGSTTTFAKTLRLTSDQLVALQLRNGPNSISFSVNRATCHAYMYFWRDNAPIVISDIDGTITKSDALGHVLNMIGRDWTHLGVAKLYTDIVANGYHILYLTSRSVGQADTTRTYLNGVAQEGFKLPRGPVILSPDRTMAALRREIYLRKPEAFKMKCLRDIRKLFSPQRSPFYAGFGNRLTDALSYRTVNIPSTRIFTINTDAEVSLDLLSFNKYKSSYVTMRELVDHFFPPVGLLVAVGGEEYTDFNYWRDSPAGIDEYLASDDESSSREGSTDKESIRSEDEGSDASDGELGESFLSYESNAEPEDTAYLYATDVDLPNTDMALSQTKDQS